MQSFKNLYIVLGLLTIVFSSCEEEVVIDLKNTIPPLLVVEGRITDQLKQHQLKLTLTSDYFSQDISPAVSGAVVSVTEKGSEMTYSYTEIDTLPGVYQAIAFAGVVGETYVLEIEYNNQIFRATAYMDEVAQIDTIEIAYSYNSYFEEGNYIISLDALEPEPLGNNYLFNLYLNDTLFNNQLNFSTYENDEFFNGEYIDSIEIYHVRQEEILSEITNVKFEMLSISREEYDFIRVFLNESLASGSIFNGPPSNIPSNIKNVSGGYDGFGFFGASSVSEIDVQFMKVHDDSSNDPEYSRRL